MKINVVGSIFGSTGYDSHTRSLFNALYKVADVKLSTQLPPDWIRMVNDAELDAISKPIREDDINIIITTPHNWKLYLGLGINCAYAIWEGSHVPLSYIDEFINDKINLIFVASNHTKQAILNTLGRSNLGQEYKDTIINKIKIIPHGVDRTIFFKK